MMHVAPISAPKWIPRVQRGPYHMVLAQFVLRYPRVAEFYRGAGRKGVEAIILDNGAFEGIQLPFKALDKAISLIEPDVVVLPDVVDSAVETLKLSRQFLETRPSTGAVMFVPHGKDVAEVRKCWFTWRDYWVEAALGEYELRAGLPGYRRVPGLERWDVPKMTTAGGKVHLLGVHDMSLFLAKDLPKYGGFAYGVDTSYPFVAAAHGELLTKDTPKRPLGDPKQYEDLPETAVRLARLNTYLMRRWVEEGEWTPQISLADCRRAAAPFEPLGPELYFNPGMALEAAGVPPGIYLATKEQPTDRLFSDAVPYKDSGSGSLFEVV